MQVERWSETVAPDARRLRHLMEAEGYSVFEWSDRPGVVYEAHSHPEDQSHWILSGALELEVGGELYTLHAGDRDFLPANTLHAARVASDVPVIYLIGVRY